MSQARIKDPQQRPISSAETTSQQPPFVGPTPNMLPSHLPSTSGSSAVGGQVFSPTVVPFSQFEVADPPAHWLSFPHLILPSANPYPNLKAHRAHHQYPPSFDMAHNEQDPMNSNPPSTPAQSHSLTKPIEQRHDSLTREHATNVSPASSVPPGWKGSRIPSGNVPRKAPLAARSSDESSPTTARKIPKAKLDKSASGRKVTPEGIRANRVRKQKSFETPSGIPRKGRLRLDDDSGQDVNVVDGRRGGYAKPPIGLFAPPKVSATITPPKPKRLRPQYSYEVPSELLGTKTALGPDNWNEYVYLMEQLWLKKITAHEFDSRAKPIFQVLDERTRKEMNNIMVLKMIEPRLNELQDRGQSTKSGENM